MPQDAREAVLKLCNLAQRLQRAPMGHQRQRGNGPRHLKAEQATRELTNKEKLVLRLNDQYPKDIGILSAYFLNHVRAPTI